MDQPADTVRYWFQVVSKVHFFTMGIGTKEMYQYPFLCKYLFQFKFLLQRSDFFFESLQVGYLLFDKTVVL